MLAVIGDVHGSIKTLKKLYYTLLDKYLIHRIVFLGDIVDRGLYSKEVVEFLMDRQGECLMTFLRGNHEDMLINSVANEGRYPDFIWHERVGLSTVASFMGITMEEAAKKTQWEITPYFLPYMEFFNGFKEYYIEHTKKHKFLLSHAGPAFFFYPMQVLHFLIHCLISSMKNVMKKKKQGIILICGIQRLKLINQNILTIFLYTVMKQ